jgi:molecular chaperone DnaK
MPPVHLGIDLGTTNSTAAAFDGSELTLIRNAHGATLTPSVVRIDARGVVTVGARARRFLDTDPDNTRGEFKRLMGTAQAIRFPAAGVDRRPEELAAEVLRALRSDVREQLGFLPERAVVSVPALFELPQSAATAEAARLAGFDQVELLQEPVASALAAGWKQDDEGTWLVYDLGGGTFDASLLETREGFLRVVGHDGDNFLGGRDFDWTIVDWLLAPLGLGRGDAAVAPALRALKLACEEAKIDLSRGDTASIVAAVAGRDVEVALDRATLEALTASLVDRSIDICRRLVGGKELARIVLVGGPTLMPALRRRVSEALAAPVAAGLDPMTLVAQGAAIYATTAGLDARPRAPVADDRHRLWLQFPAMSSSLTPAVVGRLAPSATAGPPPASVRLARDGWHGAKVPLDAEGAFVVTVELQPRRPNAFRIDAFTAADQPVPVEPAALTIVHGLTVSDPPLSRSIGVATADDHVHVYVEKGAPLPARRTFVHHTVDTVSRGAADSVVRIPVVQGELGRAHLCRLVGTLEISGTDVSASLPAGSMLEITLEVDRGGRLAARAFAPSLGQVFEQVARLLVPEAAPEALADAVRGLRRRLGDLRGDAFRRGARHTIERLGEVERSLEGVDAEIAAAAAGDADAGQKARRTLLELDALIDSSETERQWPELDEEARQRVAAASRWIAQLGTPPEQRLFTDAAERVEKARAAKEAADVLRHLTLVNQLASAAMARHPDYWTWMFEAASAEIALARDPARAQALVREGQKLLERNDVDRLRSVTQELWRLLPADAETKRLGFDSGVR